MLYRDDTHRLPLDMTTEPPLRIVDMRSETDRIHRRSRG